MGSTNDEEEGGAVAASECHRGIFTLAGTIPSQMQWRDMTYQPVRGPIWTVSEGINRSVVIEGDTGIIAFDTFGSPMAAIAYRMAVQRLFPDKPVHTLVYSHDHLDHTGYASDFAPDARIIAHELANDVIVARQSDGQLSATETWTGRQQEYEIDGVRFQLMYPGPTHGTGNCAAYFPEQKLLFWVDTIIPGVGYTYLPDWHLASYLPTVGSLLDLDWDVFVPGHFWLVDRAGYRRNVQFYEVLLDAAQRAFVEGVDLDSLPQITAWAREKLRPDLGTLFRFDEYIGMNVMRCIWHFLQGGWGLAGNVRLPESGAHD